MESHHRPSRLAPQALPFLDPGHDRSGKWNNGNSSLSLCEDDKWSHNKDQQSDIDKGNSEQESPKKIQRFSMVFVRFMFSNVFVYISDMLRQTIEMGQGKQ